MKRNLAIYRTAILGMLRRETWRVFTMRMHCGADEVALCLDNHWRACVKLGEVCADYVIGSAV